MYVYIYIYIILINVRFLKCSKQLLVNKNELRKLFATYPNNVHRTLQTLAIPEGVERGGKVRASSRLRRPTRRKSRGRWYQLEPGEDTRWERKNTRRNLNWVDDACASENFPSLLIGWGVYSALGNCPRTTDIGNGPKFGVATLKNVCLMY